MEHERRQHDDLEGAGGGTPGKTPGRETTDEAGTETRAAAHAARGSARAEPGLAVRALVRDGSAELRVALAERRLVRTIAEWAPGAGLDVVVSTAPAGGRPADGRSPGGTADGRSTAARSIGGTSAGGRVAVDLWPLGAVPEGWQSDIRYALEPIADLARTASARRRVAPGALAELVRDPARAQQPLETDVAHRADAQPLRAPTVSWPAVLRETGADLLPLLRGVHGGFVRTLIAAPTELERAMLDEQLREGWDRLANPPFDTYLGVPVRMRTFVGVVGSRTGYAGLRAAVRGWGTALVLRDAAASAREDFWAMGAADLAGHIRPEGWALAGLRLPVAGEHAPQGIASRPRAVAERPIDLASTREPGAVVIGYGRTPAGRTRPVTLSREGLCRHIAVEGRSGAGKTTFGVALAHELSRQGIGFTLIEHHGSGVDQALRALDPAQAERALVVRHGDATAPGSLSLFGDPDEAVREQTISEFIDLVQKIFDPKGEGIVGPRWRRWFALLCDAVAAHWGDRATLLHVLAVASDPDLVAKLTARLHSTDRDLARRLHREIGALRGDDAANLPAWAISKFQPLVGSRIMREIVGRPHDSVDVARAMDEGRALLIDLGGPVIGTPSARMLGALWLLKHWVAMGRRADRTKPHVIIVDEAHLMTVGALPAMLAEARKFGVGVVVLSQSIDALAPDLQTAIEANVGTHVSFRLGLNTVGRASLRLDGWDPRELVRLPDLTAAATLTRDGVQSDPFLLRVRRPEIDTPAAVAQAQAIDARRIERARRDLGPVVSDRDVEAALEPPRAPGRPSAPGIPDAAGRPIPPEPSTPDDSGDRRAADVDTRPVPLVGAAAARAQRPSALDQWLARRKEGEHATLPSAR